MCVVSKSIGSPGARVCVCDRWFRHAYILHALLLFGFPLCSIFSVGMVFYRLNWRTFIKLKRMCTCVTVLSFHLLSVVRVQMYDGVAAFVFRIGELCTNINLFSPEKKQQK